MTNTIQSVCVYCSSSAHIEGKYKEEAARLGKILAEENIQLVFGGGRVGLMGVISDACMKAGGKVLGITTKYLDKYEIGNTDVTKLVTVNSMAERQSKMLASCDSIIVLPGGFGTLEEFFNVLTSKQIGLHRKPIVIVDLYGFWSTLKKLTDHIVMEKFATKQDGNLFVMVKSVHNVLPALRKSPIVQIDPTEKWFDTTVKK